MRLILYVVSLAVFCNGQVRQDPYACEGIARDLGSRLTLRALRLEADSRAAAAMRERSAVGACTAAELYKRLGDPKTAEFYELAIEYDPVEPAFEVSYGGYLRLYRGAGNRPLFQVAEKHLFAAKGKLANLQAQQDFDAVTETRLTRSLTALYERDGIPLASWTWDREGDRAQVNRPWLFFSPSFRWEQAPADFDRTSDLRDRTSEAAFSESRLRLNRPLTPVEEDRLVRLMTPMEGAARFRIRYRSAPIIDLFGTRRRTTNAQVTNFFQPNRFNDLNLADAGISAEKPFAITGNTDAVVRFAYRNINRKGLIEFLPSASEQIHQYEASGALSHYLGPDRINVAYTFVRQNINPAPANQFHRDRELMGGTIAYQIFRPLPLPTRGFETSLGRRFETRGIDLYYGTLRDHERYPTAPADVFVMRRDHFVGITARGLGRIDVQVQPTWFSSAVSNDPSQNNSQLRMNGNVLMRLLDEERTGAIPSEHLLGLRVAFVQLVVPFHWDSVRTGSEAFRSRRIGIELWSKLFTAGSPGTSFLTVAGYSRQWFPALNRDLNLIRLGVGIGF